MYHHEHVVHLATHIITWESAAQELPLPDLRDILAARQDALALSLDALNIIYADHGEHPECADMVQGALGDVARNATAAAIFALGITCRAQQTARQN
jgi:hypothetical protein